MTDLDFTQVELQQLITHHIGNKLKEEKYSLSNETTVVKAETKEFLLKYFLNTLKAEEVYSFTHPVQLYQNDVFAHRSEGLWLQFREKKHKTTRSYKTPTQ